MMKRERKEEKSSFGNLATLVVFCQWLFGIRGPHLDITVIEIAGYLVNPLGYAVDSTFSPVFGGLVETILGRSHVNNRGKAFASEVFAQIIISISIQLAHNDAVQLFAALSSDILQDWVQIAAMRAPGSIQCDKEFLLFLEEVFEVGFRVQLDDLGDFGLVI